MNQKSKLFLRWFILLFTVSVSVTVIPCSGIYALGLFGEVKSSTVAENNNFAEKSEKKFYTVPHKNKGINFINIWYELWCIIIYMVFIMYKDKLPRGDTIVTLKVRMDN